MTPPATDICRMSLAIAIELHLIAKNDAKGERFARKAGVTLGQLRNARYSLRISAATLGQICKALKRDPKDFEKPFLPSGPSGPKGASAPRPNPDRAA